MKTRLLKLGFMVAILSTIFTNKALAYTAVANGDWTSAATWGGVAPSGNVSNQDIIIPSGIEVNLNTDVTFSGLLNSFTVDGTLTSSTNNWLSIEMGTFNGSGDVDVHRIMFSGILTSYTHSGDLTANTFMNSGAVLVMASQVSVADSLILDDGSLTLNTGSNLSLDEDAVIVRNDGTLATSGGVFNASGIYHVRYTGGSKTTGIEINSMTLENVDLNMDDNNAVLTMGSDLTVNGDLKVNMGILNVAANDLEIYGSMNIQTGAALTTVAASSLKIETTNDLNSGLVFTDGSSIDELYIDYQGTGSIELESSLDIAGELHLHEGTLSIESGATLTMNTGSMIRVMNGELQGNGGTFDGTNSYDVVYMGDSTISTGEEVTGSGLNDVELNIATGQLVMEDDITVGGLLDLQSGSLNLNGNNLTLNGTFEQITPIIGNEASDLYLNITTTADDTIWFDNADQNLEQLSVDVTTGNIVLGSVLHIHDELSLINGSIMLTNHNLIIEEDADITGYSDTRYIITPWNGKLEMYILASQPYKVFPIGTEESYSPASIQQQAGGTSTMFKVKAFDGLFVGGTQYSGFNSAMTESVVDRTWLVESDAANVNMNLKLGWMVGSEVNSFDRTNAYVSHYSGGSWDSNTAGGATSGMNSTYEIDRTGITSLSPFAVADEDAELIVDEANVLTVSLYPNPCNDIVNIGYDVANGDQLVYQVMDAAGRTYDAETLGSNQMDVSGLSKGVYLLKITNVSTNAVAVKQFIKK
jgi:hypothetical protein